MNLSVQWFTVGLMFGSGFLIGVILDVYHVFKIRLKLKGWIVSLIDVLYWFVSAGLVFSLLMWSNWGELRFSLFIAILFGIVLYHYYISKHVFPWFQRIFHGIEMMVIWVGRLLWIPIATIGTFLWFVLRISVWPLTWMINLIKRTAWFQTCKKWWLKLINKG